MADLAFDATRGTPLRAKDAPLPYINLDDGTCSIDLLESAASNFALSLSQARTVMNEVAQVVAGQVAKSFGAHSKDIDRMASAFEHEELRRALRR